MPCRPHKTNWQRAAFAVVVALGFLMAACSSDATTEAITPAEVETQATVEPPTDEGADTDAGDGVEPSAESVSALNAADRLGDYSLADDEFGTMTTVTVSDGTRTIATNALPDHETGDFPNAGNPNTISAQDQTWEFPLEPTFVGGETWVMVPGVAVNGVKFEPETAESVTCSSGETYRVEALQDTYDLGFDFNNAHVQPTGEYHYHGVSQLLAEAASTGDDLVHLGFAADGYLMYYSLSGAYSSGWELSSETRSGTDCVGSGALRNVAVEIDGTTPDGVYVSDWAYDAANGDLDSCNGVTIAGQYVYIVTDEYPFISRCLNGEVSGGGAPAGVAQPSEEATPGNATPDLTDAAEALGITVEELEDALGTPPPDLDAAAAALGITADELRAVLPPPPD